MFAVYGQKNVSLARRSISWAIIFNLTITPIVQNLISLSDENSLQRSRFKIYQEKWFTRFFIVISIPIRGILVAVEEIYFIIRDIKRVSKFRNFLRETVDRPRLIKKDGEKLSEKSREIISTFYDDVVMENDRKLALMASENSIQLIYQSTILLYEYFNPPIYELNFSSWSNPSQISKIQ